jgi:hypothetical protein
MTEFIITARTLPVGCVVRHLDVGVDHRDGVQRRHCREHVSHEPHRIRLRSHQSAAGGGGLPALRVHDRYLPPTPSAVVSGAGT